MVPDKFNMVDMGGIDLIMMQGEEVPGLYDRLVESITQCRYQCLYNWLFDGVIIPPTYVELEVNEDDEVVINEGVTVSDDDVIHIYSLESEIIPLLAEENGVYNVPAGVNGFNPVTVDVPSYTPVINSLSITENGTYTPPTGVDGYSPVTVNVSTGHNLPSDYQEVDFLENANTSSYFDTGIAPTQNTGVDIIYRILGNTTNGIVAGSRGGNNLSRRFFPVAIQSSTPESERYVIGEYAATKNWSYANKRNNEFNNGHNVVVINATNAESSYTQALSYSSYVPSGNNLYLFATSDDDSPGYSYGIICDIYYCKITDTSNNTVLAELIPCFRKSDNVKGFYDLVSNAFIQCVGTFYYNNF